MEVKYNAKPLAGWLTAEQAGEILGGLTRQAVLNMMNAGKFNHVTYVGKSAVYLIPEIEVLAMKERRNVPATTRGISEDR